MALSATQIAKLNRANRAMQDSALGTLAADLEGKMDEVYPFFSTSGTVKGEVHVVTADEVTATKAVICDRGETAIAVYIVQVYRNDILMKDYLVDCTGFTLELKSNSTDYELTAGDVVCVITF